MNFKSRFVGAEFFPTESVEIMKQIWLRLGRAERILIISHVNPDGDTIGANLALSSVLKDLGKKVVNACADEIDPSLDFLVGVENFVSEFNLEAFDVIVIVDCGSAQMIGFDDRYPKLIGNSKVINIDHHASNPKFGAINWVDSQASATVVMIYHLLKMAGVKINRSIAMALLTGLYFDTGSFMHSNTSDLVYKMAAELVACGANPELIAKKMFRTRSVKQLKLWGEILENLRLTEDGIVVGLMPEDKLKAYGLDSQALSGVIDFLNMVPKSKFALLLSEDLEGNIKGSCRTQVDGIDLSKVAGVFGGGGHRKASGFSFKGNLNKDILSG